jgi:uncharacterized protein YjbJ (UPF0337 family)
MSNERKGSTTEEASAFGQRVKGAAKDAAGAVTGNEALEREGEAENAEGRARQGANEVLGLNTVTPRSLRSESRYVTGLYRSPEDATRAYEGLTSRHGYKAEDVDVLMSDETRARYFGEAEPGQELKSGSKMAEGLGKGSAIGGGVGAALATFFAVGSSIAIPGLGIVVAGPIAAALAGAGAGAATGGLVGALIGAGIPEDRAAEYERGLREGGIVVGAKARDDEHAAQLERDFGESGGTRILR